ncbi:formate dehydrogenase accessory sulfurtransferase FdhD [Massilia psychrophila]|nr:formate dehydrogenase accessory sulfurtransferase FdhD [Massilia psychrophila]GGE67070.1 sulfurtransferase FdhD [Massilia psychrophila]
MREDAFDAFPERTNMAPNDAVQDDRELPPALRRVPVQRWCVGPRTCVQDVTSEEVVEETPVALVYNGISQAVMLATPQDLEDFAIGFSVSERLVACASDIYEIDIVSHLSGIEIQMRIAASAMFRIKQARRMRTGKTGCGLCGIESLEQFSPDPMTVPAGGMLDAGALHTAMAGLCQLQLIHTATGGAHAAGWATWDGRVALAREDVGRHNALDKLIGALSRAGTCPASGFAVITSRASFEMVQKVSRAGISVLAAVSAPTALAVRMADQAGVSLAGFVRANKHVIYSHPHRFKPG